jgi:hypothetical protein
MRVVGVLLRRRTLRVSRVAILRLRDRRNGLLGLLVDEDVVSGEDTLLSCALVSAHPPILVHVLVHSDTIILLEGQVAAVGSSIAVKGTSVGNSGLDVAWRRARRRSLIVGGWRGRMRLDFEILEGLGRRRVGGRCRSSGLGSSGGDVLISGRSLEGAREGGLAGKSGIDGIVDGVVNYASLKEVLEFLRGVSCRSVIMPR